MSSTWNPNFQGQAMKSKKLIMSKDSVLEDMIIDGKRLIKPYTLLL